MEQAQAHRRTGGRKRWWLAALICLVAVGSEPPSGQQPRGGPAPVALTDPRLGPLRAASARWEARQGPTRAVVDQVCLVPDLATFCAAVAGWDRSHYYPILIEDAESTLRFLRAFRPARVVRFPRAVGPIAPGEIWSKAREAVQASWREPVPESTGRPDPTPRAATSRGARPPSTLGPTPPGLVVSNPDSPMLAGAVALAAGRFQPLIRFDSARGYWQTLTRDELDRFSGDLTRAVAAVAPDHLGLGDDCDFLTIAGNYPYRYRDAQGQDEAVDDALGRTDAGVRWAYAGRILGDPAQSVYRAMCALFLQPDSATLFNGYDEAGSPWADYSTRGATSRLAGTLPTSTFQAADRHGSVASWHEAFDPENRSGLVWVNSHGSPTVFRLQANEEASTTDVPRTVPAAVVMIHSFSAADPTDPATIAGRWLTNGAFVYFGSMNEPYLQAFRTPQLAIDLIANHLPMAAALRNTSIEPFDAPWRLVYLGDPLFRLKPNSTNPPARVGPDQTTRDWPIVGGPDHAATPSLHPSNSATGSVFRAGFDSWIALASSPQTMPNDPGVAATIARLADLNRDDLDPATRRTYDSVLADLLFFAKRRGELRSRIEAIPPADRSPELARWLDAIRGVDFAWLLAGDDFDRIIAAWRRIIGSTALDDFQRQATDRVGALATNPTRRADWAEALRAALQGRPLDPAAKFLGTELKRVEAEVRRD